MTSKEAAKAAVEARVAGDKNHGWGADDSMAVIAAIWESEVGEAMPSEAAGRIREVVNPSAFRQKLESAGLLLASEVKRKVKDGILSDYK